MLLGQFYTKFTFHNESRNSMQILWSDESIGTIILVTTEERNVFFRTTVRPSSIYRSNDDGKSFIDVTSTLNGGKPIYVRAALGLQRHNHKKNRVYLICHNLGGAGTILFISENGGDTWTKVQMPFLLAKGLVFHPKKTQHKWILGSDALTKELFISSNGGYSWKSILHNADLFAWSEDPAAVEGTIYALQSPKSTENDWLARLMNRMLQKGMTERKLMKTTTRGSHWTIVQDQVYAFSTKGKFLYISVKTNGDSQRRRLKVSTNGGATFDSVQLPDITHDRFFSILDMEDDMIFIHVDDPFDTGYGKLYTSDSSGIIFSLSLDRHFFPNNIGLTDFFRVNSMRATYITSQMNVDGTLHSLISHNRGASWKNLELPPNVRCLKSKKCYLQVNGAYSRRTSVNKEMPLSSKSAVGVILLHGHAAEKLQNSKPDVYVSSDGGYSWIKALDGPHHYQIADHGGLIIAVPADTVTPKVIKFSTDAGRCWHSYHFTSDSIRFTGLLTEPGNRGMVVALYGFEVKKKRWSVHVLDFNEIITRECKEKDYEEWFPHIKQPHPSGKTHMRGCVLGKKESFYRVKKDSLCANGYTYQGTKTVEYCQCTKEDYSCEYGFTRTPNHGKCVRDPLIQKLDVCIHGHAERIKSLGYRLIPGDVCEGGFKPNRSEQVALHKPCDVNSNILEVEESFHVSTPGGKSRIAGAGWKHISTMTPFNRFFRAHGPTKTVHHENGKKSSVGLIIGLTLMLLSGVFLMSFLFVRFRQRQQRQNLIKYSLLNPSSGSGSLVPPVSSTIGPSSGFHHYGGTQSSSSECGPLMPSTTSQDASSQATWNQGSKPRHSPFGSHLSPVPEETRKKGLREDSDVDLLE